MLGREGIEISRLFLVAETSLDAESMLPAPAVAELTAHLAALAADAEERARIARRTLAGAVTGLSRSAAAIAEHTRAQQEEGKRLAEEVDLAFSGARTRIGEAIGDGSLLRGEVLARWQDVVGTGEFFRSVENVFSRVRDRLGHALTGRPARSEEHTSELQSRGHLVCRLLLEKKKHLTATRHAEITRWEINKKHTFTYEIHNGEEL